MSDFTTWRSLVDGEEIGVIPDSGGSHQWNLDEGEGDTVNPARGSLTGSISGASWNGEAGVGGFVLEFSDDDLVDFGSESQNESKHFAEDGVGAVPIVFNTNDSAARQHCIGYSVGGTDDAQWQVLLWDGSFRFRCIDDNGSFMWDIEAGTVPQDDYVFYLATANGSTASIYEAQFPNPDLSEVDSASISGGTSFESHNENLTLSDPNDIVDGFLDIPVIDDEGWSQQRGQDWADNIAEFYE